MSIYQYITYITLLLLLPFSSYAQKTPIAVADTLEKVVSLSEIVVKPGKEKYSKKNNPAVDFMERIRAAQDQTNPYLQPNYNFEKYERITLGFNNVDDTTKVSNELVRKLPFLAEHIDTCDVTGGVILPLTVKEKVVDVYNRTNPDKKREFVTGIRRNGLDEIGNVESIQTFLEELMRDIDLYQNDITLLSSRFVSPLSKIGPDFYKYYLTDTVKVGNDSCIVLSFAPRNNANFGFVGRLYVPKDDPTMFVKKVSMTLSKNANVNYIENFYINQEFERDSTGLRLKMVDDLYLDLAVISGTQGLFARKYTTYSDHNFGEPSRPDIFNRLGETYVAADAYLKPDEFWGYRRDDTFTESNGKISDMINSLRQFPVIYWSEKILRLLISGYVPLGKADKIEYGPINTTVSFNDVEGVRFRLGGITTANLNKHWFFRVYGAYGIKDHKWKYYGEAEYSFNKKKVHSREFPMRSIRLSYGYDIDAIGQDYAFTNADNIFISLKRMDDTLMIYKRDARLDYIWELDNHFSWQLSLHKQRKDASRYLRFHWADGRVADHLDFSVASLKLRYSPGEKFMQTKSGRNSVNHDRFTIGLTQTFAPANFLGSSKYTINKTEFELRRRFWFSAFGYLDAIAKGGHVWSTVPFTELFIPNANLTYTIQPESFALLNPMEFVTDSYVALDLNYCANGAILNYIPLVKKLKWREAFTFRSYWGRLSDKNNPEKNPWLPMFPAGANPVPLKHTPYMEMAVGIDNILHLLRVDYIWRLTYRSTPDVSNHGVRIALHITF